MLTLIQIYQALKEIADLALTAKDLPDLVNQIRGLDAEGVYLHALEQVLKQEQGVFLEKGINFDFDINIFKTKLNQNGIDFERLAVSPDILNQQIGQQIAFWLLADDVLLGVDIGVEVDSGWAQRVAQATNEQYASALYEKLFNDAVKQELRYISNQVSENKKTQDDVNQLLILSGEIIAQLRTDYTSLDMKSVQDLFGISAYLVEINKIKPATQERLKSFYQGDLLWWDIIAAGGDVKRDLQETLINFGTSQPENLSMLCVAGEPGAGKSTLAWRIALEISRNLDMPLIQIRDNESEEFWYRLENGLEQYGKPIVVLVDDVFRDESTQRALTTVSPDSPLIIVSTSRLNEIPDDLIFHFKIEFFLLSLPSDREIARALLTTKHEKPLTKDQIKKYLKLSSWLVFMYEITTGGEFSKRILDSVRRLKRQDPITYQAYEFLCFVGQYNMGIPVSLLERLDSHGNYYNIVNRSAAKGLIFLDRTTASFRVQHPIIAKFATNAYNRNPQKILDELLFAIDSKDNTHRIFLPSFLIQILNENQPELVKSVLPKINDILDVNESKLNAEISLWIRIYTKLNDELQVNKLEHVFKKLVFTGSFSSVSEWMAARLITVYYDKYAKSFIDLTAKWLQDHPEDYEIRQHYLGLVERKGNADQVQDAINVSTNWLQDYPISSTFRKYLKLIEKRGSLEQIQAAIDFTTEWLGKYQGDRLAKRTYFKFIERHGLQHQVDASIQLALKWMEDQPNEYMIRRDYIGLIEKYGDNTKIQNTIVAIRQWLDDHPEDIFTHQTYLGFVERNGSPEQIQEMISTTTQWLQKNPTDNLVRQVYIGFVERNGNPVQIQDILSSTTQWLYDVQTDDHVRQAFLGFVERNGNPDQISEFIQETSNWLQSHPANQKVYQAFLGFIERNGTPEQIQEIIQVTIQWLQEHQDDHFVRQAFLGLVERKGNSERFLEIIQLTIRWLREHQKDRHVRQAFLRLIERNGNPEQVQEVIQSTTQWLQEHPADNFIRHNFLGFVEQKGTPKQVQEVIQATAEWLQKHPEDYAVRQIYIGLIGRKGTTEEIQDIILSTAQWLQEHPADNFVRQTYLRFVKWQGNPDQLQDAIRITIQWLQDYPQVETVHHSFLNLIEQLEGGKDGSKQHQAASKSLYAQWVRSHPGGEFVQQYYTGFQEKNLDDDMVQSIIQETIKWTQEYPEDEFIHQFYLDLIKREGSIEQIQDAIQSIFQWLNDGHGAEKIRKNYLHLVGQKGKSHQIRAAIQQAEIWLQEMSDVSEVLPIFISLVDRYGTKEIVKDLFITVPQWLETHPTDALVRQTYLLLVTNIGTREQKIDEIAKLEAWISSIYFDSLNVFNKALILARHGRLLLSIERYEKAEEISKRALNEFKGMVPARINLAWSFYYQNKKKDTRKELQHSVWWAEKTQRHPESDAYYQFGCYWFMEHDYGYAEEYFRKAIRYLNANPNSYKYNPYKYYIELGRTLTVLRDERAIKVLQEAKEMISDKLVDDSVITDLDILIELANELPEKSRKKSK